MCRHHIAILGFLLSQFINVSAATDSCNNESNLRSSSAGTSAIVLFSNNAQQSVKIYWLDFSGKRVFYKSLNSGESYRQPTYTGHPWLISDASDNCFQIFIPEQSSDSLTLTDTDFQTSSSASSADLEHLFNLVEPLYPQYFSPASSTQTADTWTYRYYADTGIYLGSEDFDGVYIAGGLFGEQILKVGRLLDLLELFDGNAVQSDELNFSRTVSQRVNAGLGIPEAALNFQQGQTLNFVWNEQTSIDVNGLRFDFKADGGTSWVYFRGTAPSISEITVFKDLSGQAPKPGAMSLSVINNSNFLSPVFVTYTFE